MHAISDHEDNYRVGIFGSSKTDVLSSRFESLDDDSPRVSDDVNDSDVWQCLEKRLKSVHRSSDDADDTQRPITASGGKFSGTVVVLLEHEKYLLLRSYISSAVSESFIEMNPIYFHIPAEIGVFMEYRKSSKR